ncbi:PREDICTED: LOW QUALITY PROTEIN: putative helicase MOV-10 [Charadrius vociferus]|uniref:LOW QUALITY PROTEIN: putative helicase MOV-10 n=1 Tax=Charadrius vociferus TaxID=50402 RepID=UPI000521B3E9|nr:PREDICTED: LOW QUALITY PROTEIN: putative helicase MOV-10 [Charadrius vociferus]
MPPATATGPGHRHWSPATTAGPRPASLGLHMGCEATSGQEPGVSGTGEQPGFSPPQAAGGTCPGLRQEVPGEASLSESSGCALEEPPSAPAEAVEDLGTGRRSLPRCHLHTGRERDCTARQWTDTKIPNFSCTLYALRVSHRAQVHGESVHFKKEKRRVVVADQYRRSRTNAEASASASGQQPAACNGCFRAVVVFEFTKEPEGPFSIGRYVTAVAESQLAKDLGPSAPFQPYQASLQRPVTVVTEDGIPPDSSLKNELEKEIPLGAYHYPKSLKRHTGRSAQVPGVAENRPSVLKGDHLFAHLSSERGHSPLVQYKGYVHGVELEKVRLGFSSKLQKKFVNNLKFDVTFTFNRLPLQANEEQCKAVTHIVTGMSRPAPYLIFGPPGTGKTVTLVEAIKQVWTCFKDARILACAPSNNAADLLCQRLIKDIAPRYIYRLIANSRNYQEVPADIRPCCNWDDEQSCYVYPSKEHLGRYRILITTLVTAGRLASANFPPGFFSHVFIDECGQAVEPESVVAIAGLLNAMDQETNPNGGQLVLAGDPQQLGPVLRSPLAIKHGLGTSLLERLMLHNPLYKKSSGGYDPQFVTKLLWNYRSHEAILKIPNELFYDSELKACESDELDVRSLYCAWEELPKKGFPIIFHGVCGEDRREAKSPSFFNTAEIEVLVHYLKKLLQSRGKGGCPSVSPKEVGIISPYRKQVEKIRKAITSLDPLLKKLPDISLLKVGSVEEFQGQERRVILISTVRSCSEYFPLDQTFNLGFLKNPKTRRRRYRQSWAETLPQRRSREQSASGSGQTRLCPQTGLKAAPGKSV